MSARPHGPWATSANTLKPSRPRKDGWVSPRVTAWGAYRHIAEQLRARITSGEFSPGSTLPSEAALCDEYGVARNTLRRALDQLTEERLIEVRPGRGRVVVTSPDAAGRALPRYVAIAEDLRSQIESGQLRPGEALPSEATLAKRYGVARGTARQALAELAGAGLVAAVHGKGWYVRPR
ncbi:MAG TPA: GntR family transcriptional regulator [Natronosporangium sp.]